MRSVLQQAVLKGSFPRPALALPWCRQRGHSLDNLVPVLLQRLHFSLMFCEKGRTRKLEPPPKDCKMLRSSHSHLGFLSLRSFEVQKLQDINKMKQSLSHWPCRICHLMCFTLSRLTTLCSSWSWLVCAGQGWTPGTGTVCGSCPPQMCRPAFPSSYVTTSSAEHFLDLLLF